MIYQLEEKEKGSKMKKMISLFMFFCFFILLIFAPFIGNIKNNDDGRIEQCKANVSDTVRKWEEIITINADIYGITNYTELLLAIIAQESDGDETKTPDIMQSSVSAGFPLNTFTTPEASVEQGVKYFGEIIIKWNDYKFNDIRFAIQSYNFGIDFLNFAKDEVESSFSELIAEDFLNSQGESYGDIKYVEHVYQYYMCMNISDSGMIVPTKNNTMNERYGYVEDPINGGGRFHSGIDLQCSLREEAYSVSNGVVQEASYGYNGGFGNVVLIKHSEEISTLYSHFDELKVQTGDTVEQGQVIGLCGNTGFSAGAHLHFEVRANGKRVDPVPYLPPLERSPIVSP